MDSPGDKGTLLDQARACLFQSIEISINTDNTAHIFRIARNADADNSLTRQVPATIISRVDARRIERRQAETLDDCDGSTGATSTPASSTHEGSVQRGPSGVQTG